jgi:hypothetical protein
MNEHEGKSECENKIKILKKMASMEIMKNIK